MILEESDMARDEERRNKGAQAVVSLSAKCNT